MVKKVNQQPNLVDEADPVFAKSLGINNREWKKLTLKLGRIPNRFECIALSSFWREKISYKSSRSLLNTISGSKENLNRNLRTCGKISLPNGADLYGAVANVNREISMEPEFAGRHAVSAVVDNLTAQGATPLAVAGFLGGGRLETSFNQYQLNKTLSGISRASNLLGLPMLDCELNFYPQFDTSLICNTFGVGVDFEKPEINEEALPNSVLVYLGNTTNFEGMVKQSTGEEGSVGYVIPVCDDPVFQQEFSEPLLSAIQTDLLNFVVPVGLGGIGAATFFLSAQCKKGLKIDLDRIPNSLPQNESYYVFNSESPHRILAIVDKSKVRKVNDHFSDFGYSVTVCGEVTKLNNVEFEWLHNPYGSIPLDIAFDGFIEPEFNFSKSPPMLLRKLFENPLKVSRKSGKVRQKGQWEELKEAFSNDVSEDGLIPVPENLEDVWIDFLANTNLCSRKRVSNLFDLGSGGDTLISFGIDASVIRVGSSGKEFGLALSAVAAPLFMESDPYLGAVHVIAEGMRNVSVVGAQPVGIIPLMNLGDNNQYEVLLGLFENIRGLRDASNYWKLPVIAEDVNFGNRNDLGSIMPVPSGLVVGYIENLENVITPEFKDRGDRVLVIGDTEDELGRSEYLYYCLKTFAGNPPNIDFAFEEHVSKFIQDLISKRLLKSAHDIAGGGVGVALTECSLFSEEGLGVTIECSDELKKKNLRPDSLLFSETPGRFIVSCDPKFEPQIMAMCLEARIPISARGMVGGKRITVRGNEEFSIAYTTARNIWSHVFESSINVRRMN